MSHKYQHDGYEKPSVTTILGAVDGEKARPLMQWSANCAVEWIRDNCGRQSTYWQGEMQDVFLASHEELNEARFAYKTVSQEALDVGSEVHAMIEEHLKSIMAGNSESAEILENASCKQVANAFSAYLAWFTEHDVKPIALEQTVYGQTWAGMLDFVGWFDGKIYVIDYKTSKAFNREMRFQVAAYRWAWNSNCLRAYLTDPNYHGKVAEGTGVLRLDKKTGVPEWKDTTKTYEKDLSVFLAAVEFYMLKHNIVAKKAGYNG